VNTPVSGSASSWSLEKNAANFVPLTPISFLFRAAQVHPLRPAIVHGTWRSSWAQTRERCLRLASALHRRGVGRNDVVSVMAPNIPAAYEAHFGVPMCGAVLNALNIRLDPESLAFMLRHSGAKVLITDGEFADVMEKALALLQHKLLVVDIDDPTAPKRKRLGKITYEELLAEGDCKAQAEYPQDEWDAIALNYTSGTTGDPKGVVCHHRGGYLNAVNNALVWNMERHPIYLWTLPMFHCNGWCFPWTVAAMAGTNVCLRRVEREAIWKAIVGEKVTHMCGAPIVYSMMMDGPSGGIAESVRVRGFVAGASPSPALLQSAEDAGVDLTHVYGLTEVFGPAAVCEPQTEWSELSLLQRAERNSRQGVQYPLQEHMTVIDPQTGVEVPADGKTMGELVFRGNIVMKGYLKNPGATEAAFAGGWFHTGDLGVRYPDGYAKILDRSKDIIISGGENISSVEVEEALYRHPAVFAVGVVARTNAKWGESPCAFVELRKEVHVTEADLIDFCRKQLAAYKVPKTIVFGTLPKTSTGKIQKYLLRQQAKALPETV
jgi:fatty-acyl-CoA synthase